MSYPANISNLFEIPLYNHVAVAFVFVCSYNFVQFVTYYLWISEKCFNFGLYTNNLTFH